MKPLCIIKSTIILWLLSLTTINVNCFIFDWIFGKPKLLEEITANVTCFNDGECFPRFPMQQLLKVPIGIFPSSPKKINVAFYSYTCETRFRPHIVSWNESVESIRNHMPYNPNVPTMFIVHGFQDFYEEMNWMGDMKDFILKDRNLNNFENCKHNVIAVNWKSGSQTTYTHAMANTMVVGDRIARMMRKLITIYGGSGNNFTVIGHSLGSHISGFAGAYLKPHSQLRNIIALDPAGPGFNDISEEYRLDPSDARLVITIHTNGGEVLLDNFGTMEPWGHYNFYPNGGSLQPGCEKSKGLSAIFEKGAVEAITDTVACSHRRATWLVQFNDTLLTEAESMAYQCDSYESFLDGRCGSCDEKDQCKPFHDWFGWWNTQLPPENFKKPLIYYLNTKSMVPWSTFTWQMKINLFENGNDGSLRIVPIGTLRNGPPITIDIKKGVSTIYKLMTYPKYLGRIGEVNVTWYPKLFSKNRKIDIKSIEFNFMSNSQKRYRKMLSSNIAGHIIKSKIETRLGSNNDTTYFFEVIPPSKPTELNNDNNANAEHNNNNYDQPSSEEFENDLSYVKNNPDVSNDYFYESNTHQQ